MSREDLNYNMAYNDAIADVLYTPQSNGFGRDSIYNKIKELTK